MSSFLSSNTLLSDDVEKSSTLEDMYKALLGDSDAPSSFGNFGFSSDEEDIRSDAKSTENVSSTSEGDEEPGKSVAVLDNPSIPRLSLRKEKPTEVKDERKESTSSSDYEDDEDDDDDEDEEEEDDEESEPEDEYDIVDLPTTSIISHDGSQKKNSHDRAPKLSVTHEEADIIQPADIITDEELEAILDLDEDTLPEPTHAAELPTSVSNDAEAKETPAAKTEQSGETEVKVTATPIKENLSRIQPQTEKDHDNVNEVGPNHKVVNSIPLTTNDSTDDENTSGSDEEKTTQTLEQVVIVRPQSHINNNKTPLHRDNTLCVEKKQPNGTKPVKSPVKHTYDIHSKFKNETSYRCCVCCIITLICFIIVAFILSLVAISDRCNCNDTKLLQSQLLLLMEEQNCPNSWRFYEGSCYGMPSISKKSYNSAKSMCNQYGGDLVALTTKLENDYFSKTILCPRSSYMKRDDPVYIGLIKSASKIHSWSTGETYRFTNSLTTTVSNKNCVQMTKNGSWTEVDCSAQLHFYCETKLSKNPTC